ncbi:hypothetical protein [Salinisphaera shabanensis]|nr:hypothetical protein [Salinisphaera shabanensis]
MGASVWLNGKTVMPGVRFARNIAGPRFCSAQCAPFGGVSVRVVGE